MSSQTAVLERKIIGVLMRAARGRARRSMKQTAQKLGVSAARLRQYEMGTRDVSLPELEDLASFLRVPVSFFLGDSAVIPAEKDATPSPERLRIRRSLLGATLKASRLKAGQTEAACAEAIGRPMSRYKRYETGQTDIPVFELDRLAHFLSVPIDSFLKESMLRQGGPEAAAPEAWTRLPQELRAFVMEPNSLPYLRMAMKFRDLPTAKLKELGEILLVVR